MKRADSPEGPFFPIGTTTTSSFVHKARGGKAYYYAVSASNQNGTTADSVAVTPILSTGITLTAGTFKDDSVFRLVSHPGRVEASVGLGANTPAVRTANGYLFQGYSDSLGSNNTYSGSNTSQTIAVGNYVGHRSDLLAQANTGDSAFNLVLNNGVIGSTQDIAVTLNNLTVGKVYSVLFF